MTDHIRPMGVERRPEEPTSDTADPEVLGSIILDSIAGWSDENRAGIRALTQLVEMAKRAEENERAGLRILLADKTQIASLRAELAEARETKDGAYSERNRLRHRRAGPGGRDRGTVGRLHPRGRGKHD